MILAVDAGNSRVKWGLHDGSVWMRKGWADNADAVALDQAWLTIAAPDQVVVSNVAGELARHMLENLLSRWAVAPRWITSVAEQCGVRNHYAIPAQLGCDRWAALIAAWRRSAAGCVVVNAGTAVTIDALADDGTFLGGMIVPGMAPMRHALASQTAKLTAAAPGNFSQFPTNTADAVYSGILSATAGAVEKMVAALGENLGKPPLCLVGGGDAGPIWERLSVEATIVDNLVLDGLIEIAHE